MTILRDIWGLLLLKVFIWSGSKLFGVICIYNPDDENIKAVHFGINEYHLKQSASKLGDDLQ